MSEQELEMLRKAGEAANNAPVPVWVSVAVFGVFLAWAVWYIAVKLDQVNRGQNPGTLFGKVFGGKG